MEQSIQYVYLLAASLFIFGLKRLGSPTTARSGNTLAAGGMLLAIIVTLLDREVLSYPLILAGIIIGGGIGAFAARFVKMTAMPQLVAIFNGLGGGASALVALSEFSRIYEGGSSFATTTSIMLMVSVFIGVVTLSGSILAFGKLQEVVSTRAITFPLQKTLSAVIFVTIVGAVGYQVSEGPTLMLVLTVVGLSLLLGVLLVVPIGGADMPVVVSLLNSYSGLAAASAGFLLGNNALIIGGTLVGAAGLILTQIMCKAMNRSLANVMFGAFGATIADGIGGAGPEQRVVRRTTSEESAILLGYARSVIVVPGYGLAAAQAQHQVRELGDILEARGVSVSYAIHPVAGRMPGHMNVLLAEANVSYEKLHDLDEINDEFEHADVALVLGANDVTNPAARDNSDSPLYGMPILNVDYARNVLFLKRSLSPGFAGVDNDLFYKDNTLMLFGDAKASVESLVSEVKAL